jgi:PAS domain S-box-containing protein
MTESNVESSMEPVLDGVKAEKIKVLHVDDEQGFLKVAKQCLEMQGPFQVDMASSVEEAMEKMKKETYDAVVSDYQMPGKDGLQFLKELRQKGNNIPFIIFTGKGREEVVIKALNQGADHYENKKGGPETVYSELSHDIINAVRTRRAEQELRIQREELQVILDSMPAKIWYKDRNNRLVRVNKAFAEYMGVSKENLEGKPLCDLFPPDIAQKCWEEDKEVITTGQPKTDILDRHESAQGIRWFSTGKVPCREKDGNIIGTINFSVDITERKKAEEEIENLARFSSENPNPILRIAKDGVILYANAAAKSMLSELKIEIGRPAPHHWRRLVSDALDSGLRKDVEVENEDRMFLFIVMPVANTAYVNVYGIDVTERNKALERLRILNEKLGVVGKLTRHDVRNKLSAVIGNTYLTKKTLPNDHKALAYLKEIELACRQTTGVLDFAAAYESLGIEGLTLMDVDKAVEEAVSLISELKGVKVVNNCQGLTVVADSALRQLFFNLIENSLKHGKNVSQIKIHYEEGKDRLKLFYEDNGFGIPKANKPKLFHGGFTTGNGLGYGLSLIKSMMEIYGWTIEEEGEPRKGAKFVMTIPKKHITMRARNTYP